MTQTIHLTHNDPAAADAIRLCRAAFPDYKGRTFEIRVVEGPINCRSSWSGGSRTYFTFVKLDGSLVSKPAPAQSAFDAPVAGLDKVDLPTGVACVSHTYFCGRDLGLRLFIRPDAAAPLLPAKQELTEPEARVLAVTSSLKNTYGGRTNIRFYESALSRDEWDAASLRLHVRKLLRKNGSVTPEGRNAINGHEYRHNTGFRRIAGAS